MSAWFVMSALGFYPVTPGSGYYAIGSPLFEEIKIHLDDGKDFIINSKNNNTSNIYIQSAKLDLEKYEKSILNHQDIMKGGTMELEMGSIPNSGWAVKKDDWPVSAISDHILVPVPFFEANSSSFQEELSLKVRHINPEAQIYTNTEGEIPVQDFKKYRDSIITRESITIDAYAVLDSLDPSMISSASFYKIQHDRSISIKDAYSNQYTAGGDIALIDGQHGGPNFRTGSWQGYYGVDLEATIDMGRITKISKIAATFLQDQKSWIFMPESVEFSVSRNNYDYRTIAILENQISDDLPEAIIQEFTKDGMNESGRFIRVRAINRGICPAWHVGAGEKAWIFVDEITVE
jgi:hypothetical protein